VPEATRAASGYAVKRNNPRPSACESRANYVGMKTRVVFPAICDTGGRRGPGQRVVTSRAVDVRNALRLAVPSGADALLQTALLAHDISVRVAQLWPTARSMSLSSVRGSSG
jgi:hypothetical protein